jgi:hypothetical protein
MPLLLPWSFYHGATKLLRKQKFYLAAMPEGGWCSAQAGTWAFAAAGRAGFLSAVSQQ